MNTIEQIRAEIERRMKVMLSVEGLVTGVADNMRYQDYKSLLSFLDTLESEKPMQEGLEEEIGEYMSNEDNNPFDWDWRDKRDCARHFAKWGAEHLANARKTLGGSSEIPNYLNELADYARRQVEELLSVIKKYDDYSEEQIEELRTHLMAMFLEGAWWQKEQMLKDAVEGTYAATTVGHFAFFPDKPIKDLRIGDKVHIIIVKEDEK